MDTTLASCLQDIFNPYTALSYMWGDAKDTRTVKLCGHDHDVTSNLETMLRHIRLQDQTIRVWVDALCINQKHLEERSVQVLLMGSIYSYAEHTIIYLGDATETSNRFFQALPASSSPNTCINKHLPGEFTTQDELSTRNELLALAETELLSRPWFHRQWILQELVLSKDPWVQCGSIRARWTTLIDRLCNFKTDSRSGPTESLISILLDMDRMRKANLDGSKKLTLWQLLKMRKGFRASDPRDMVFALLGLIDQSLVDDPRIKAAYDKPYKEVLSDTVLFCYHELNPIETFDLADSIDIKRPAGLASWVPNWCSPNSQEPKLSLTRVRTIATGTYETPCHLLKTHHSPSPGLFVCFGYKISTIQIVTPDFSQVFWKLEPALVELGIRNVDITKCSAIQRVKIYRELYSLLQRSMEKVLPSDNPFDLREGEEKSVVNLLDNTVYDFLERGIDGLSRFPLTEGSDEHFPEPDREIIA